MGQENIILKIFKLRFRKCCDDTEECRKNPHHSPIYDILDIALIFGVLGTIHDMTEGRIRVASKKVWSQLIGERAWKLEDTNWHASDTVFRENDLLKSTIGDTRYLSWWAISDLDYRLVHMCETMSRIICHASLLKRDDYRLKGLPMSNRTCTNCDMYHVEDILHIITQCLYYHNDHVLMYEEIYSKCPNVKRAFEEDETNTPYYLLGRNLTLK